MKSIGDECDDCRSKFFWEEGHLGCQCPTEEDLKAQELDELKQILLKLPNQMQNAIVAALPSDDSDRLLAIFEGRPRTASQQPELEPKSAEPPL